MSFKSRTERNIEFLDSRIRKLESQASRLKQLKFQYHSMLLLEDKRLLRIAKEMNLKVKLVRLPEET